MTAPEVLWRLTRPDDRVAHCVLTPGTRRSFVVWYLDDVVQGVRDFATRGCGRMASCWWARCRYNVVTSEQTGLQSGLTSPDSST